MNSLEGEFGKTLDAMSESELMCLCDENREAWWKDLLKKTSQGRQGKLIRPLLLKAIAKRSDPFHDMPSYQPHMYEPKGVE